MSALVLALAAAGCELAEVAAPASDDVLVVEAVLRVGAPRQFALLHRSMEGRLVRGEPGARVEVETPSGGSIQFEERPLSECLSGSPAEWGVGHLTLEASCYASPLGAGAFVQPGGRYELRIRTRRDEVLRGRTDVPGAFGFRAPSVALDPATLATTCSLPSDPFQLVWSSAEGAWAYIASLLLTDWGDDLRAQGVEVPDTLELTGVSISAADTSLAFPANVGLFQRGDFDQRVFASLAKGLPTGTDATLVVFAADRNYINAVRGGSFNPSGNIRGSSVVGNGVGVFGSIVPLTIRSPGRAAGGAGVPPCPLPS